MTVLDLDGTPPVRAPSVVARVGQYLRARREVALRQPLGLVTQEAEGSGLRRQEVAQIAGISPEYYALLERGEADPPSREILSAIAAALGLDPHATEYLQRIGRDEPDVAPVHRIDLDPVMMLAPWAGAPTFVVDATQDVLAANHAARQLSDGLFEPGGNVLLRLYRRGAEQIGPSWNDLVEAHAAAMRFRSSPNDPRLHAVVGELSMHSSHFRRLWARHDARPSITGRITTSVRPIGEFELAYQCFDLPGQPGCTLVACYAIPGTPAEPALAFLMASGA